MKTRPELIQALNQSRQQLESALAALTPDEMETVHGNWSVKQTLAHLTAWEAELVTGLAKLKRGQKTFKTQYPTDEVDTINDRVAKETAGRPLERVQADFVGVRKQLLRQLEGWSDKDLNVPRFKNKQTLVELVMDWVVEHELEHATALKTVLK
jgi:uncharacterized damage-inducible protein DinB